jgi:hypothetical protein
MIKRLANPVTERVASLVSVLTAMTVVAAISLFASNTPAYALQAKPAVDWSFYVNTASTQTLYNLGCNQGHSDANNGNINSEVILDFGGQLSNNTGTLLPKTSTTQTYAQIETLAYQFAYGYYVCTGYDTTSVDFLMLGTNNSYYSVTNAGGKSWEQVVQTVINNTRGFSRQVVVEGANDMEPGFGPNSSQGNTINWVNGYSVSGAPYYFNYGNAPCSTTAHNNTSCAVPGDSSWTQYGIWYVSWDQTPAFPLPEIYYNPPYPTGNPANANEWEQIALYGLQYQSWAGVMMFSISGPLDELDLQSGSDSPTDAWDQLWTALNSQTSTAQSLGYSMEIHNAV